MKQLVFIIPNIYSASGIARVTNLIMNELSKSEEYLITAISFTKYVGEFCYPVDRKIKIIDLPFAPFIIRKDTLAAAHRIKELFQSDFEGTFIIDDVGYNIPAWLGLKHCKKARFISWSHMHFFNGSRFGFSGIGKRLAIKKFDYLVALTKEDKGYYDKILKAKNVVQIYNPKNPVVKKADYAVQSKKIISCGYLNKIKGFDMLIEVAKNVFQDVSGWEWDIYGRGVEKENLQSQINEYGLNGKVNLKGYCSELLNIYKDYSFFVFTSRSEGCPMAMIEAQSVGLPMISFDFKCGPKDLITEGENGFIIHDWDLDDMAKKIKLLINNVDLRVKFAQNADINLKELDFNYVLNQWKNIL